MSEIWQYQKRTWQNSASPKPPLTLSPIIPVLLYTGEEAWNTPVTLGSLMTLPSMLEDFVPQYTILNLRLRDVSSEELTQSGSAVSWILHTLKFAKAPFEVLSHQIDLAVAALEKLSESQQEEWRRAMRFILLLIRHKREKSERKPLFEQVSEAIAVHKRKEVTDMILTDAQELMLEGEKLGIFIGMQQGLEQGIKQGNANGMRALLISQLLFKFPPLSGKVQARVMRATDEEIEAFSRKILSANSLAEMGL